MAAPQPQLPVWTPSQALYGDRTHQPYATRFFLKRGINEAGTERWLLELKPNTQAHMQEWVLSLHPLVQHSVVYDSTGLCSNVQDVQMSRLSHFYVLTPHWFSPCIFSPILSCWWSCSAKSLEEVLWISQLCHSCLFPLLHRASLSTSATSALNLFPPK